MFHADSIWKRDTFSSNQTPPRIPTLIVHGVLLLHMLFTQQAGSEILVAHGAFEGLDVDNHVAVKAAIGSERCGTNITLEGLHSCVRDKRLERQHLKVHLKPPRMLPQVISKH